MQEQVLFRMVNALVPLSEFPHFFSDAFYQAIKDVPFESFRSTMAASHATLPANQYDYFRIREYERRSVLNGPRIQSLYAGPMVSMTGCRFALLCYPSRIGTPFEKVVMNSNAYLRPPQCTRAC